MQTCNKLWFMSENNLSEYIKSSEKNDINSLHSINDKMIDFSLDNVIRGDSAIIRVTGALSKELNLMSYLFGYSTYDGLAGYIEGAIENPKISKIILELNSNGGQVAGLTDLKDVILKAKQSKPIYAYVSDMCYSAGYYIASLCDKIYASPTGSVGSIGTIVMLDKSDDGNYQVIRSKNAQNKALDATDDKTIEQMQSLVDNAEDNFLETISQGRNVTKDYIVNNYGNGLIFTGKEALEKGMIDGIATLEKIVLQNIQKSNTINHIEQKERIMDAEAIKAEGIAEERARISAITRSSGADKLNNLSNVLIDNGISAELSVKIIEAVSKDLPVVNATEKEAEKKEEAPVAKTGFSALAENMAKLENNPVVGVGEVKPLSAEEKAQSKDFIKKATEGL